MTLQELIDERDSHPRNSAQWSIWNELIGEKIELQYVEGLN